VDPESLAGRSVAHYEVLRCLGQGGMGVVYLARDTRLRRTVALKFIRSESRREPSDRERFLREAQTAAGLNHPHITTVYDVGEAEGRLFIAMEYVDGQTLKDRLASGPLDLPETLDLAEQMADGLAAAHARGVIHRDIKSANVMVTAGGEVKLMDFGLARPGGSELTRKGAVVGTVSFMSPEQASGQEVDQRTDIWSLGVVLYEMVTGRRPFPGDNERAVLLAVLTRTPPPVTGLRGGLPAELERIIDKCLQKNPGRRYQHAEELKADLGRLNRAVSARTLTAGGPRLPRPGWGYRLRQLGRRLALPLAGAAVILLAALLISPLRTPVFSWLGILHTGPPVFRLAVLPFDVIGGDDKDKAFCAGLVEILTNKLTQVERFQGALRVVPAVETLKLEPPSAVEAWKEFRADRVISGSMQFIADQVIVTLNLIDSEKPSQLRSSDISMPRTSLAALRTAVSNAAAQILDLEVTSTTRRAWAAQDACQSDAAMLYIQARGYLQRYENEDNVDIAIGLFKRAVELVDPRCAVAFAGLGEAYWLKYSLTSDKSLLDLAQWAAERALQLNENLAEVHVTLGELHRTKGEYALSLAELELATQLDRLSESAVRELGLTYESMGRLDDAEKAYKRAIALRPDAWSGYHYLGGFDFFHGRYEDAEKNFLKITELTPDNFQGYNLLGALYLQMGRNGEAVAMFEKSIDLKPTAVACSNLGTAYFYLKRYAEAAATYEKAITLGDNRAMIWGNLGDVYRFVPGSRARARRAYDTAVRLAKEQLTVNPKDGDLHKSLARYYAFLGQRPLAIEEIRKARELSPDNTDILGSAVLVYELVRERDKALEALKKLAELGSLKLVEVDPDLAALRRDPRYRQIAGRARD
jgi:tetratricopeptide (TPR) repeat protein/predicted Ser/Thr protein kinase